LLEQELPMVVEKDLVLLLEELEKELLVLFCALI
jgi:hypothetical protein